MSLYRDLDMPVFSAADDVLHTLRYLNGAIRSIRRNTLPHQKLQLDFLCQHTE